MVGYYWYKNKVDVKQDHDEAQDDSIPANKNITFRSKYWRRIASAVAVVLMCFMQVGFCMCMCFNTWAVLR